MECNVLVSDDETHYVITISTEEEFERNSTLNLQMNNIFLNTPRFKGNMLDSISIKTFDTKR